MAARIVLVAAGLVLATTSGCAPDVGAIVPRVSDRSTPGPTRVSLPPDAADSHAPAVSVEAGPANPDSPSTNPPVDAGPAIPDAPTPAPTPTPGPARAPSASPGVSPSASPTPKRAPAASTPTPQTPAEVVAVTLAKDNRIALIDPVTGKVGRMVDLSRPPGTLAMAPDGRSTWVFGTHPGQSSVAFFDALTGARHEDLQFHQGDSPEAVAFSSDGSRAFVAMGPDLSSPTGSSTIAFVSSNGHEFGRIAVGRQTNGVHIRRQLSSVAISPGRNGDVLLAAGQASGVVWALDARSGGVLSEIEVGGGPTSIITDAARERAYVLLDTLNQVVAIDTTTLTIISRLDLPSRATAAAIGADGTVFIAGGGDASGEVWVVEPSATSIRSRVPMGTHLVGLAISSDGKSLYVGDSATNTLSVVSADTIQVMRTIPLPSEPLSVVDARGTTSAQLTVTPAAATGGSPTPTPSLVPTPTALPEGALQPDHLPAGAVAEPFVSGAQAPVALAFAPDGRLFYDELRTGKIRIVQNGQLLPDPFYQLLIADQSGSGLMGLALDPDFQDNHYVYAFFTSVPVGGKNDATTSGPNEVIRLTDVNNKGTSPTPVLRDLPSGDVHASGTLRFGPDGKLYVSLGDNDRGTYAQDLNALAGKILRVNPDGSMPDDNPFVGDPGKQAAIWAYGFHNAYSFAFHPLGHQLFAVEDGRGGNNNDDALDLIVRGANYGWPSRAITNNNDGPIAVINPSIGPTGSAFYTGDQMPEWKNDWFYCNSGQGQLRHVRLAPGSYDRIVFEEVVKQGCVYDVVTGPDGALYYSDAKGIYRIRRSATDLLQAVKDVHP